MRNGRRFDRSRCDTLFDFRAPDAEQGSCAAEACLMMLVLIAQDVTGGPMLALVLLSAVLGQNYRQPADVAVKATTIRGCGC